MAKIIYDVTVDPEAITIIGDVLMDNYIHAERRFVGSLREEVQELYKISRERDSLGALFLLCVMRIRRWDRIRSIDIKESLYKRVCFEERAKELDRSLLHSDGELVHFLVFVIKVAYLLDYVLTHNGGLYAIEKYRSGLVYKVFDEFKQIKIID